MYSENVLLYPNYLIAQVLSNQIISQKFMAAKWSENCHESLKIFEICQPDKQISKWILSIRFWSWKSFNWDCEKSLAAKRGIISMIFRFPVCEKLSLSLNQRFFSGKRLRCKSCCCCCCRGFGTKKICAKTWRFFFRQLID